MARKLRARLDILPPPQRRLWDELRALPRHLVLYGGTALAPQLGHRQSENAKIGRFPAPPAPQRDLGQR